jgi:hypothetical protein
METAVTAIPGLEAEVKPLTFVDAGIEISNGNGVNGMARRVGLYLGERGFPVKRLTNADRFSYRATKVYYRKGYIDAARSVAEQIAKPQYMEKRNKFDRPNIHVKVIIGKDLAADPTFRKEKS